MILMLVLMVWATPLILYLVLSPSMSIYFFPHPQSFPSKFIDQFLSTCDRKRPEQVCMVC